MPYYDYRCRSCGTVFEIQRSMSEQSGGAAVPCAACASADTERVFTPVAVGSTGSSAPEPVGQACGPACACHPRGHA